MASIDQLVRRAQAGDSIAVATLYETFAQMIYRYIAYRVPTIHDAEDLTAEVFVKMVEGLPSYRVTGAPFEAWLYRIAAARIVDFRRQTSRRPQIELLESLTDQSPPLEERAQAQQELETLRAGFQYLNDEQQTVLILRFVERKSHEEVAAIISKSVTAVKSIQHRALLRLVSVFGSEEKVRHYLRGNRD